MKRYTFFILEINKEFKIYIIELSLRSFEKFQETKK